MIHKGAENFRVAKYRFELKALTKIRLPSYKGSTFRGAFGRMFRRICCSTREEECGGCLVKATCPYAYIFETQQDVGGALASACDPLNRGLKIKRYRNLPRPFVLEPPLDPKEKIEEGEQFSFGLVLIGRGMDFLPYFLVTFKELGSTGIGRGRGEFLLESVSALFRDGRQAQVYSCQDQMVHNHDCSFTLVDFVDGKSAARCTIEFLTPARLRSEGSLGSQVDFHSFFSRLLERLQALSIFHCGGPVEVDHLALKQLARSVRTESSSLYFQDWTRYSSRQKTRMQLGGYKGQITYSGDLAPFLPFLRMGQYVHVGKNTTFGLGQYRLSYE